MQSVVGIKLNKTGKIYNFKTPEFMVKVGDRVVVSTANGPAVGVVSVLPKNISENEIEGELKPVERIATEKDLERVKKLEEKAKKQIPLIEEKIKNLNLDMNISGAEYSFDESKITISFTSDGRVDFRELLKVLASSLKCKIELRQIGVRDEVKAIGGLGLCGMECCCTKFLKDAEHVTVKMAKLQNLSLNPTKTGGLCGRMMCCMAFEEPVYKELSKNMPDVGKTINTPDGEGLVTYNDLLKQKVTVKIFGKDGGYKIKEYTLEELNGNKEEVSSINEENISKLEDNPKEELVEKQDEILEKTEKDKKNNKKRRFFYNKKKGDKK